MSQATSADQPLTVVLVHGAFADSSSWNGVIERLQAHGVPVIAVANPLSGIATDSAYAASVFAQIPGPVLAVGHSYGGAVITNAAVDGVGDGGAQLGRRRCLLVGAGLLARRRLISSGGWCPAMTLPSVVARRERSVAVRWSVKWRRMPAR
jgi:pimeloyl-ACP methyl ester carboxylesterase